MDALPAYLSVDVAGRCNLSCTYCPQGRGRNLQPRKFMSLEEFKQYVGDVLPHIRRLELFNWGEPFLHPELLDVVAYVRSRNPTTRIRLSTNGMVQGAELFSGLVKEGVHSVTVTISGLSEEVHKLYHRRGDLSRVLDTIGKMASEKLKRNSHQPKVRVRYLRFPYNFVSQRQVEAFFRRRFGRLAEYIEEVRVRDGYLCELALPDSDIKEFYGIDPRSNGWQGVYLAPTCKLAFENPVIRADGVVFPCCGVPYRDEFVLGRLEEKSFEEIWNGKAHREFRRRLKEGSNPACNRCRLLFPTTPVQLDRYLFHRLILRAKQAWRSACSRRARPRRHRLGVGD